MTGLFESARKRFSQHRAYRETLRELRELPLDVRLDLDIAGAEKEVAAKAVYGG